MITKRRHWWHETRSSFWFVPAVIVLGTVGLATGLIALDATVELHVDKEVAAQLHVTTAEQCSASRLKSVALSQKGFLSVSNGICFFQ